uniref:Amine oxidase domain-containing protein n=1 Tax=Panagrolaimus sp. PS1159 TaxID=55785 RepID=A0AC35FN91_9BILA
MDEKSVEPLDITILEKSSHPGGLASTVTDSYGFSWDLGIHITGATRYPEFLKILQSAVPEWHCIERCVKADMTHVIHASNPHDNYVPYPVQSSVPYFPEEIKQKCLNELTARFSREQPKDFANFDEFSLYPANCIGMGELWKRIAAKYPQNYFSFNSEVTKIDPESKQIFYKSKKNSNKENQLSYDYIFSTMPLTHLGKLSNLCPDLTLKHSKVALVGVGLHQPQSFFAQELSWAYFPQAEIIFYRCTVISNFSPLLVPDSTKFWSVLCEIGLKDDENADENLLIEETVKGLIKSGIIDSEEQVHSIWTKILDYGYPIPTIDRESELQRANNILEKNNIYSRGRFGGWRYETSNQDYSFELGRQVVDKVFLDIPETL